MVICCQLQVIPLVPTEAGTQGDMHSRYCLLPWIPAFAEMSGE
jgi:hypothetical protein